MLEQYQAKKEEDAENSLKTRKRANMSKMTVSWWNGGGKLIPRLKVNPELRKYLDTKPDIFVYGEALIYRRTKEINIDGYITIVHKAMNEGVRRGIVIFYRKNLANVITKASSSKKFDIVWLRMKTPQDDRVFGFF